jgi:hypothetical protein
LNIRRPLDQLARGDFSRSDQSQLHRFTEDDTLQAGTESEWSQKERARKAREEDERLEMLMLTNEEASFDQDLHKELYRVFRERFSAHAIRSDNKDIKTLEIVSNTKLAPESVSSGPSKGLRGRYLAEVPPS